MKGNKIAVSQRLEYLPERKEWRDSLDHRLASWLEKLGGLPIPVPNVLISGSALQSWLEAVTPRAIVLSGGEDIGENLFRDDTERNLLDYAYRLRLPVLGLCRGMQLMAHYAGADLEVSPGHVGGRHALRSLNGEIFPNEVNSFHNWRLESCPMDFTPAAEAEDGTIEAILHRDLPWEGWMWHPEREKPFNTEDIERARGLLGLEQKK